MADSPRQPVDIREYKVMLDPSRFEDGFEAAAGEYARSVVAPVAGEVGAAFAGRPVAVDTDTVLFYDTPALEFRNINHYVLRRRSGQLRNDLTLKHRSTSAEAALNGDVSSTFTHRGRSADAIKFENEILLPTDLGRPGWRDSYSLDNVVVGEVLADVGFAAPDTVAGWAAFFPVLGGLGDAAGGRLDGATPVIVVNGIEVEQLHATVGTLRFGADGADGIAVDADVVLWKNSSRKDYAEFLIAEFTFLVESPEAGKGRAAGDDLGPCGRFYEGLQGRPHNDWIFRGGKKASMVYAPPGATPVG